MTLEEEETVRTEEARHRSLLPRIVEAVFYLVIATSFAIGIVWWNEGPPMVVVERYLETQQVEPGGELRILNVLVTTKTCPVEVHRVIVDAVGVRHELEAEVLWPENQIGRSDYTSIVTVPKFVHEGMAKYRVSIEWECNPLQKLFPQFIQFGDIDFEVIE